MANNRRKGAVGELELVHTFRDYGYEAERTAQRSGRTGVADVVLPEFSKFHIEVKRRSGGKHPLWGEEAKKAMAQAVRDSDEGSIPVVIGREDRKKWHVMMSLDSFMLILALSERDLLKKTEFSKKI